MASRTAVLLVALAALAGCDNSGSAVSADVLEACVRTRTATERVFRTAGEWEAFLAANDGSAPAVDFPASMVAVHLEGPGSACVGYSVDSVEEAGREIVVRATRHESPGACIAVVAYPGLVVSLRTGPESVRFEIGRVRDEPPTRSSPCV